MLDSKHIKYNLMECSRMIPLDDEAKNGTDYLRDTPLQTKNDIYDKKCKGCGFCRIEVYDEKGECLIFNDISKAITEAQVGGYKGIKEIHRTCEYPGNILETDRGPEYPTLTEIVMNGCMLWKQKCYPAETNETLSILTLVKNEQIKQQIKIPDTQISR